MRLIPSPSDGHVISNSELDDLDGLISSEPLPNGFGKAYPTLPLVIIGTREKALERRMKSLTFVRNDDRDIGRYGASYLDKLGNFRSFGFVPTNIPYYCSILRLEGYQAFLAERGIKPLVYRHTATDGSPDDLASLGNWLSKLPKPSAVMAVHDLRATHVLEAARTNGLNVPRQLAVIGVDNDELLCDFTDPRLSSIAPDHVREGELAAIELKRLLTSHRIYRLSRTVRSKTKKLIERDSSAFIAPAAQLARRAMTFIHNNATKGLRARDVAIELNVSRRLADLRFKECYGKTILDAILEIRLDALKQKLKTTSTPIKKITAACGFANEANAKALFKRRVGVSMRVFRANAQSS